MGVITSGQTLTGKVGVAFSQTPAYTGTFSASNPWVLQTSLPLGLTLNSLSGLISGTPTQKGNFTSALLSYIENTDIACGTDVGFRLFGDRVLGVIYRSSNLPEANIPSTLQSGVTAISGTHYHFLALKSDGTVVSWGRGNAVVPPLSNVVAVSAGYYQSIALKADGTVIGWGETFGTYVPPAVPDGLAGVIAISAGSHNLALKSDGTVVGWGYSGSFAENVPAGLSDVIKISAGAVHSLALKSNGEVVAWGGNSYGQSSVPADAKSGVIAIAAGARHSLALKNNGQVISWGEQIPNSGVPSAFSGSPPTLPAIKIAAGGFSMAISVNGTNQFANPVYHWGMSANTSGSSFQNSQETAATTIAFSIADGVPIITAGQTASGTVGTAFTKTFSLTDSANRPVTSWSATGLPSWATLNTTTGAITGTPQDSGSATITLTATGPGGSDTQTATISIAVGPPIITAGQSFTGKVGVAFSQTPALDDALDRPATSWGVTGLPAGLALNTTTGAITGAPTAKGSFTASFTATGGGGTGTATSVSFTIAEGVPIITAGQTASGTVGTAFSKTFSLTDSANRPVTSWSATGLPSWATLNTSTGAITGAPQDSGSATISLTATGPGGSDTETATISIAVGPPIITAGQSFTGKVGVAFSQTPALEDALDRPATSWARTSGALPTGLALNTSTGAITGTPTAKGSFTATFTATGGGGTSAATSLSFTIAEGVPLIVSGQGFSAFLNSYFKRDVALENEANRSVTGWSVSGAVWAQVSASGEIFGTPVDSGDFTLVVTATGPGGTDTEEVSVLVRAGGKVVFQVPKFDSPPVPTNDILVRGGEYIYGRWTGKGAIPPGINWVGMEEGLRFWGTPTRTGQWEAEFEGPYPANFESDLTQGGSGVPPLRLDAGDVPEEIVVSKFTLQFEAVEQTGYTYGQVLKELFSNPSGTQTARRLSWSGSRCIGARGLSPVVLESGVAAAVDLSVATSGKPKAGLWLYAAPANAAVPEGATARGIQNGDLNENDYSAADWVFSEAVVIDRSYGGCLLTAGVGGRSLLDGVKRAVAVNGVISI